MLESNKATDFQSLIEFDERNQPMLEFHVFWIHPNQYEFDAFSSAQ